MKDNHKERVILFSLRGDKTRIDVASDLDITPQMLGSIERGDRNPSLHLAKKIADYYETTVDEIFFNQVRHIPCLKVGFGKDDI